MNDQWAIEVENLCKSFNGYLAVDHVSLKIKKGEIFGFLGPNGSGKTTTMRMIAGLYLPDSGSGRCFGLDLLKEREQIRQKMGYMTQKFGFYEDLTAYENLNFVAEVYGVKNRKEAVSHILQDMNLEGKKDVPTKNLSGGQKQRLALAAALLPQPDILLLDEPTAGVDPKARRGFWDKIHELAARGITVLVSTHYMDEALRCHKLAYISFGKILRYGRSDEIIHQEKLSVLEIAGEDLTTVAQKIKEHFPNIQTAQFGLSLHCISKSQELIQELESFLKKEFPHIPFNEIPPNLEHVFLTL